LTDIDNRRNAEEALRRMQARFMRAAQIAAVGELAASIAHEVNQPLAAVVVNGHACVRWLSLKPPNVARALEAAERIVRDATDAGQVVGRVRSLFKRTAGERVPLTVPHTRAEWPRRRAEARVRLLESRRERSRIASAQMRCNVPLFDTLAPAPKEYARRTPFQGPMS
jgi:phosphoglycerate-specific signal transduction histidine kinase